MNSILILQNLCKQINEIFSSSFNRRNFSLIVSKARPTMVLTVLLPSLTGNESSEANISCIGCTVTLQQRRYEETGCANQKWEYDETLKFLIPFNSNQADKGANNRLFFRINMKYLCFFLEITAANRANICSYTVNYDALSQPVRQKNNHFERKEFIFYCIFKGFYVSILNVSDQAEDVPVCLACSQAMRGKYRLVKIEPHIKFTCAIGKSKFFLRKYSFIEPKKFPSRN